MLWTVCSDTKEAGTVTVKSISVDATLWPMSSCVHLSHNLCVSFASPHEGLCLKACFPANIGTVTRYSACLEKNSEVVARPSEEKEESFFSNSSIPLLQTATKNEHGLILPKQETTSCNITIIVQFISDLLLQGEALRFVIPSVLYTCKEGDVKLNLDLKPIYTHDHHIVNISCPTHAFQELSESVSVSPPRKLLTWRREPNSNSPPKDLVLLIHRSRPRRGRVYSLTLQSEEKATSDRNVSINTSLVTVLYPLFSIKPKVPAGEVLFLVDCTKNMAGYKMRLAKDSLLFLLAQLRHRTDSCPFNIIGYKTTEAPIKLFEESCSSAGPHLRDAVAFVRSLRPEASKTTTRISDPLSPLLNSPWKKGLRQVVIITGGGREQWNAFSSGLRTIQSGVRNQFRIFGLVVEDASCLALLQDLTRQSGGSTEHLTVHREIEACAGRLFARIAHPVLTNVSCYTQIDNSESVLYSWPTFSGDEIRLYSFNSEKAGRKGCKAAVKAAGNGGPYSWEETVSEEFSFEHTATTPPVLHICFAAAKMNLWEIHRGADPAAVPEEALQVCSECFSRGSAPLLGPLSNLAIKTSLLCLYAGRGRSNTIEHDPESQNSMNTEHFSVSPHRSYKSQTLLSLSEKFREKPEGLPRLGQLLNDSSLPRTSPAKVPRTSPNSQHRPPVQSPSTLQLSPEQPQINPILLPFLQKHQNSFLQQPQQSPISLSAGPLHTSLNLSINVDIREAIGHRRHHSWDGSSASQENHMNINASDNVMSSGHSRTRSTSNEYERSPTLENRWARSSSSMSALLSPKDAIKASLLKINGILNKMTPEKFDTLLQEMLSINISHYESLKGAVNLVFCKAINEVHFSELYAVLSCKLSDKYPPFFEDGQKMTFRRLLLNRCHGFFLVRPSPDLFEHIHNPEERLLTKEKLCNRLTANVGFIGQLYLKKMLPGRIIKECAQYLLSDKPDSFDLDLACALLSLVGKEFEGRSSRIDSLEAFFNRLKDLKNNQNSRTRFGIERLFELRDNRWIPRREKDKPQTIASLHAKMANEQHNADVQAGIQSSIPSDNLQANRNYPSVALDIEKIEEVIEHEIFPEYMNNRDPVETLESLNELYPSPGHAPGGAPRSVVLSKIVSLALDIRDHQRELVSELFQELHSRGFLSPNDIAEAFSALFEVVEDLELDSPQAATLIGGFAGRAIASCLSLKEMMEKARKSLHSSRKCTNILLGALGVVRERMGEEAALSSFRNASLDASFFTAKTVNDVRALLEKHDLLCLLPELKL